MKYRTLITRNIKSLNLLGTLAAIAVAILLSACNADSNSKGGSGGSGFGFQSLFVAPVRDAVISSVSVGPDDTTSVDQPFSLAANENGKDATDDPPPRPTLPFEEQDIDIKDLEKTDFSFKNCAGLDLADLTTDEYYMSRWLEFLNPTDLPIDEDKSLDIFTLSFEYKFYLPYYHYCFAKSNFYKHQEEHIILDKTSDTTTDYKAIKMVIGLNSDYPIKSSKIIDGKASSQNLLLNFLEFGQVDMKKIDGTSDSNNDSTISNSMDHAQKIYQFSSPLAGNKQKLTVLSNYYMFDFSSDSGTRNKQPHQVHTFIGTNKGDSAIYIATAVARSWYDKECDYTKTREVSDKSGDNKFKASLGLFVDSSGDIDGGTGEPGYGCVDDLGNVKYANTATQPQAYQHRFYSAAVIKRDSYQLFTCINDNTHHENCKTYESWKRQKYFPAKNVGDLETGPLITNFTQSILDGSTRIFPFPNDKNQYGKKSFRDNITGSISKGTGTSVINLDIMWKFLESRDD